MKSIISVVSAAVLFVALAFAGTAPSKNCCPNGSCCKQGQCCRHK